MTSTPLRRNSCTTRRSALVSVINVSTASIPQIVANAVLPS